jgi:hypothetical protein
MKHLVALILLQLAGAMLGGCALVAKPQPIVKTETVSVPVFVHTKFDAKLTAPTDYAEPDPACWENRNGIAVRVFCNGQLADMRLRYRAALDNANSDKAAIRQADTEADAKP